MKTSVLSLLLLIAVGGNTARGEIPSFPGAATSWNGFDRFEFPVDGLPVSVVTPDQPSPGRPWVWHGEFFGHKPDPDVALLERGFHIVYVRIPNLLGSPQAVDHWNTCFRELTGTYQLCRKVALVGLSRGGLYCYNWAIANPDRVACLYGDAPVCDFKSWPGGFGAGRGSPRDWQLVKDLWQFASDEDAQAYGGNPVDNLEPLARAGVPLLHIFGDADEVVPWDENTQLIAERYRALGGRIDLIRKPGVGHHPHGLDDSTPIVEFITEHASPPRSDTGRIRFQPAEQDTDGFLVHRITSGFQRGETELRILLPDELAPNERHTVLFVLPVEADRADRWGDGLLEIKNRNLHNDHQLICVQPTFSELPWYADHPSDPQLRQEAYLLEVVLPSLKWTYSQMRHDRDGRLLVGFSKSGWGAWSLLLRNPDQFGRAAAWDAPLTMDAPGRYGSGPIFGTPENFREYHLTTLISEVGPQLGEHPRLIHLGYGNFRASHLAIEETLLRNQIPHIFQDGPPRSHHWQSGWLPETIRLLAK